MKKTIFTLLVFAFAFAVKGQDASDFGSNDVLIADFETTSTILTDSLWLDEEKTQPVVLASENVVNADNPLPISNVSATSALYTRPAGTWKALYMRFPQSIVFNQTPTMQLMVYPEASSGVPATTRVDFRLVNDKGEMIELYGSKSGLNSDEWSLITLDTRRFKSDSRYNTLAILINPEEDLAAGTKYYIDAIGFKAPEGGEIIPATVFSETFGTYNDEWQQGIVPGQSAGEKGLGSLYASEGGFTSGIPFTWVDANGVDAELQARTYGMNTMYDSPSGGGRIAMDPDVPGSLVSGDINVKGYSELNIGFALGTQLWWAYDSGIAGARPKVEISVDGGAFYEIYSNSTFLQATGNFGHFDWGDPAEYEDQLFRYVDYGVTSETGDPISPNRINIKISYKEGAKFWIDDLWLSGTYTTPTAIGKTVKPSVEIYPNPVVDVLTIKGATQIEILDLTGKSQIKVMGSETVNVSKLNKGIYLLSVCVNGVNSTSKLVKK